MPQSQLVGVRLASQAAGYLAALGPVVSEPAKLVLLRNSAGMSAAAPATLVETGMYWFTSAILGLAGAAAASLLIADARVVWTSAALFGVAFALLVTRSSLLTPLVRWAGPRAPKWLRSAELIELRIRSFRDRQPQAARTVLALATLAQLLTLAEVAGVLWAVGIPVSILHVLAIEAAGADGEGPWRVDPRAPRRGRGRGCGFLCAVWVCACGWIDARLGSSRA